MNERWEIVRENRRCWKFLKVSYHRNYYKRADGSSCDKYRRNHHRALYNETKNEPFQSNLSPYEPTSISQGTPLELESCNIQGRDNKETKDVNYVSGICPVLKIRSEAATKHSTIYLPCQTPAGTRLSYSKELQNNWEYPVYIRTRR